MKYVDFALKIEPKQGDVYPVGVASPAGEVRSTLVLPFAPDEVGSILVSLGQRVRGGGPESDRDIEALLPVPRASVEEMGGRLFAALFADKVRSLFDWSLGNIHGTDTGLRIKIHIDPTDPSLAQLASLPWEFLYRRETRDWLNLSRYTPIVRYLDVQRPHTALALSPPLRILVLLSQPVGCRPLDLAKERKLIEDSWANLQGIEVEFLETVTPEALGDRLTEKRYHVVHYMGHGDFDEDTGCGVLLLEDEHRHPRPVDGPTLGILLRDVPSLRLVVLNACETARLTKERGLDPFAGVASSLVMAGIPAVVAMQFPISDDAAISFADRFYALLARGDAVDTAVAEGRRAIRTSQPETLEWGTPVLFMRAADGIIFNIAGAKQEVAPPPEEGKAPEDAVEDQAGHPVPAGLETKAPDAAVHPRRRPAWLWGAVAGVLVLLVVSVSLIAFQPWRPPGHETPSPGADQTATVQPAMIYAPISLSQVANSLPEVDFPTFPSGRYVVGDVPFDIAQEGFFSSQAEGAPDHLPGAALAADVPHPLEVDLLITAGDGYTEFNDKEIGRIRLLFSNGQTWEETLRLGWNIREWKEAGPGTVNTADHPALTLAFSSGIRVVDMLTIEVPTDLKSSRLTAILIEDTSEACCGSLSPAINIYAVTVLRGQ